jgi:hypothetical protein
MPKVILRGRKNGHRIARLVLDGSSSNPVRQGVLNGEPFEVTDEEFARLDQQYMLESADGQPEEEQVNEDDEPEKGGVK